MFLGNIAPHSDSSDPIGTITSYAVPITPSAVTSTSDDPAWTPGNWRTVENSKSSDETESRPDAVLNAYNDSMAKIASLSDARVESRESRLQSDWASASENEKARWEKHVDEACREVRVSSDCPKSFL